MAAKKGFFQKTDQKKQYSENVLNNVESAYRPKNRGRVKNPISSNTMSGEEVEDFADPLTGQQESAPQSRFRKPVGYAFAGPQAKRQNNQAQVEAAVPAQTVESAQAQAPGAQFEQAVEAEFVHVEEVERAQPEPEIQVRTGKPLKKKTNAAMPKSAPKKSKKLSQPEIQVFTGNPSKKPSQPEIQVSTGNPFKKLSQSEIQVRTGRRSKIMSLPEIAGLSEKPIGGPTVETSVALELIEAAIMLEAMQELEVDVQESKGNYEPIEEAEVQVAKSLGFQRLFNVPPAKSALQYELDLDSIAMEEFQPSDAVELQPQPDTRESNPPADTVQVETLDATEAELLEEPLTEEVSAAELGLSFDPQAYGKDKKKTMALNAPKQGIKRSHRGTIEAVFQPNGKVVEAQYNRCGILIQVDVAGAMKLTRSADNGTWTMSFCDESQPVNKVSNVSFDRLGNLCYSTEDGHTTVICADGRVVEK
jgi:hypothetical protein